jgi:hypothetical protein
LLLTDPTKIAKSFHDFFGDRRHAFTQWFVGWLRHPYTVPQIVTAYVDDFPGQKAMEEQLLARRVEEGGRLRLVRPNDPGVFLRFQSVQGFTLASDVQIYLDLLAAGHRGDEQAAVKCSIFLCPRWRNCITISIITVCTAIQRQVIFLFQIGLPGERIQPSHREQ